MVIHSGSSTLLVETITLPSARSSSCATSRVSRDIMQQTDKVNGMRTVKFVELARRYTEGTCTYRDSKGDG